MMITTNEMHEAVIDATILGLRYDPMKLISSKSFVIESWAKIVSIASR